MAEFKDRLETLLQKVLKEGFLGLSTLDIRLYTEKNTDELMGYGELTWGGYYIDVDEEMKKATDAAIEGGLAHELSHILIDEQKTLIKRWITDLIYTIGTKYKRKDHTLGPIKRWINNKVYLPCAHYVTEDERRTDWLAVNRGYGPQLLAFLKFHDKEHEKYKKHEGLTLAQLKQHLKQKS